MVCEADQRLGETSPRRGQMAPAPHDLFEFELSISEDGRHRRATIAGAPFASESTSDRSTSFFASRVRSADGAISLGVTGIVTGAVTVTSRVTARTSATNGACRRCCKRVDP